MLFSVQRISQSATRQIGQTVIREYYNISTILNYFHQNENYTQNTEIEVQNTKCRRTRHRLLGRANSHTVHRYIYIMFKVCIFMYDVVRGGCRQSWYEGCDVLNFGLEPPDSQMSNSEYCDFSLFNLQYALKNRT